MVSGALMRRGRPQEKFDIERRQKLVFRLRFVEKLTESEIVTRLARVGIVTSRPTVSRDVAAATLDADDTRGLSSTTQKIENAQDFLEWSGALERAEVVRSRRLREGWIDVP